MYQGLVLVDIQNDYFAGGNMEQAALLEDLRNQDVNRLTICGAMSHLCIDAMTRAAFDLGFSCAVVEDACATRNLVHKGHIVEAKNVHAAFMSALAAVYATILSADEFFLA